MDENYIKPAFVNFLIDRNLIESAVDTVRRMEEYEESANKYLGLLNESGHSCDERMYYAEQYHVDMEYADDESKQILFFEEIFIEAHPSEAIDFEKGVQMIKDYQKYQTAVLEECKEQETELKPRKKRSFEMI